MACLIINGRLALAFVVLQQAIIVRTDAFRIRHELGRGLGGNASSEPSPTHRIGNYTITFYFNDYLSQEQSSLAEDITRESYKGIGGNAIQNQGVSLASYYNCWLLAEKDGEIAALILAWVMDLQGGCASVQGAKIGTVASGTSSRDKDVLKEMAKLVLTPRGKHRWWVEVSPPLFYSWVKLGPVVQDTSVAKDLLWSTTLLATCSKSFMGDRAHTDLFGCYRRIIGGHPHEKIIIGCPPPYHVDTVLGPEDEVDPLLGQRMQVANPYSSPAALQVCARDPESSPAELQMAAEEKLRGTKWVAQGSDTWQRYIQIAKDGRVHQDHNEFAVESWVEGTGAKMGTESDNYMWEQTGFWFNEANNVIYKPLKHFGMLWGYLVLDVDMTQMRVMMKNYIGDLKDNWPLVFYKVDEEEGVHTKDE